MLRKQRQLGVIGFIFIWLPPAIFAFPLPNDYFLNVNSPKYVNQSLDRELATLSRPDLSSTLMNVRGLSHRDIFHKLLFASHWRMPLIVEPGLAGYFERGYSFYVPTDDSVRLRSLLEALKVIQIEQAWDITQGDSRVIIAVIDDAIDIDHPDLVNNLLPGWDFVGGDNDPSPSNDSSCGSEAHGTSVAGVIGASGNNHQGIAGVSYNSRILPLRIGCTYDARYERDAVEYAIRQGAQIINASYGGVIFSPFQDEIINMLEGNDVLMVVSAGNYHANNDRVAVYPASLDSPNIIAVAASDAAGALAHWSNYGVTSVDIAAPGVNLTTTRFDPSALKLYGSFTGTSAAAPVVSGIAALLLAKDYFDGQRDSSARDLKAALLASTETASPRMAGKLVSDGVVNARLALEKIEESQPFIVIKGYQVDDSILGNGNSVIEPNEQFHLALTLRNVWQQASNISVRLQTDSSGVDIVEPLANYGNLLPDEEKTQKFLMQASVITGYHEFKFVLEIVATGDTSSTATRHFSLHTGILDHINPVSGVIQQDLYDEQHLYHTMISAGAKKVVYELTYAANVDGRRMGLLASSQNRPVISFLPQVMGGWQYSGVLSRSGYGVERIELTDLPHAGLTAYALVFNAPEDDVGAFYQLNKAYTIRSCVFDEIDEMKIPSVSAGEDIKVKAKAKVTLKGNVQPFDEQHPIVNMWWELANSGVTPLLLRGMRSDTVTFTAPLTGELTFILRASDLRCNHAQDRVTVMIMDDDDRVDGLRLLPSNVGVRLGGRVSVNVSALVNSMNIADLTAKELPEEANFNASTGLLTWSNSRPAGAHLIKFNVEDPANSEQTLSALFTINVVDPSAKSNISSGGCSIGHQHGFDPVLFLIVCLSFLSFFRSNQVSGFR